MKKKANGEKWKWNVQFEHTARATLQQNIMVETRFSHILNKARALLIDAHAPFLMRYEVIQEVIITSTKLDRLVTKLRGK